MAPCPSPLWIRPWVEVEDVKMISRDVANLMTIEVAPSGPADMH